MPDGTIRVGVVGVGRGQSFAYGAKAAGMELVAICDTWEERLRQVGQNLGVTTYTDYDKFLEHELDAVVLANYFHEHAPFAVKALAGALPSGAAGATSQGGLDLHTVGASLQSMSVLGLGALLTLPLLGLAPSPRGTAARARSPSYPPSGPHRMLRSGPTRCITRVMVGYVSALHSQISTSGVRLAICCAYMSPSTLIRWPSSSVTCAAGSSRFNSVDKYPSSYG